MGYNFYDNIRNSSLPSAPNDVYRELEQAFITQQWDNSTAVQCIKEQVMEGLEFVEGEYHEVEAWLNTIIGISTSGSKTSFDFCQLIFNCLDHPMVQGRLYQFDNQYWLSYFDGREGSVVSYVAVRRCNNWLRMIDPDNGSVYEIPCVVDYDMSSPSAHIANALITPNNHAVIKVQENKNTQRLFKTNTRFILNGRPFKLLSYQNATNQFPNGRAVSSMLELDLYLDEIWDTDDLVNGIADNGDYHYVVSIVGNDMELLPNATGELSALVSLNDIGVERPVKWVSTNPKIVSIDEDGHYVIKGAVDTECLIKAVLDGNSLVSDEIKIKIVSQEEIEGELVIEPNTTEMREYETVKFTITGFYGGQVYIPDNYEVFINKDNLTLVAKESDNFTLMCNKRSKDNAIITITAQFVNPDFMVEDEIEMKLVSMMG